MIKEDHHLLNKAASLTPNNENVIVDEIEENLNMFVKKDGIKLQ